MSSHCQNSCGRVAVMRLAVLAVLCSVGTLAAAQDQPAPKWELYGGYSFFYPGADVHGLLPGGAVPASSFVESNPRGVGASVTYNFNRWFGLTADGSAHWGGGENGVAKRIDDASFYTASMGPKLTFRGRYFSPFVEALVGWHSLDSDLFQSDNRLGFMAGGGLDLNLNRHFALRLIRGDFVFSNHQFSPGATVPVATDVRGVRAQSGVVFLFGGEPAPPVSASCIVNPSGVMVGEPTTATANASGFNPKHTLTYTWSSTGGKIAGNNGTASIDTNGIAGGSYLATAHIIDPKVKGGEASCSARFTVREPAKNPPNLSCSANPSTVQPGGNSTISCTCTSPDNVPVTVGNWSATAGSVSGMGNTATLNTSGASPGPITVSAICTDSRGLTSPAAAAVVTVEAAPTPPPTPQASKLSQCDYPNPVKPWRVDNTCKAILDDVAKNLQQNADSRLVIVGNAEPTEKRKNLAGERAVNAKAYLTGGEAKQGIDPGRIETRTGSAGSKTAEFWIVPAGAMLSGEGTQPVDEMKVKAVPDHPHVAAKKKAKSAAQ